MRPCSHGYSQHGDYVFGWKGDSLQKAIDARCTGDVCSALQTQTVEEADKCTVKRQVDEDYEECKFPSAKIQVEISLLTISQDWMRSQATLLVRNKVIMALR